MGIGYLLGGIACLVYALLVGYFGGVKKAPGLLKLVKMKINKKMSDEAAVKISRIAAIVVLIAGIFFLVFGAIQAA
jgi:hypothetical protein